MSGEQVNYKEYAKQMRENAARDSAGNVVCSAELWEEIASKIENSVIAPSCRAGDTLYHVIGQGLRNQIIEYEVASVDICFWEKNGDGESIAFGAEIGDFVFLAREDAEKEIEKRCNRIRCKNCRHYKELGATEGICQRFSWERETIFVRPNQQVEFCFEDTGDREYVEEAES